jgi:hypothetical protein
MKYLNMKNRRRVTTTTIIATRTLVNPIVETFSDPSGQDAPKPPHVIPLTDPVWQ